MSLPKVPLSPSDVNLLKHSDELIKWLKILESFFGKRKIAWYIQGSLATNLFGIKDRKVTDIDVRVKWSIDELYDEVKKNISKKAILRGHVSYTHGEFRTYCVKIPIPHPNTFIDITTEIRIFRKDINLLFEIPFDPNYIHLPVCEKYPYKFPICSLEYLLIYKLINQRDIRERKNDLQEASSLINRTLKEKWKN